MTKPIKRLAVLTSGGDAPGMNAAIRAVVRTALAKKADVFAIWEGYQGLVEGGPHYIRQVDWSFVSGIMNKGGTVIGSARCKEFRTREGRRQAAYNLVSNGINYLVVIGGDGSLTGANLMRSEWKALLEELIAENKITADALTAYGHLGIVGLVGSIDNDMCGTDITIGADTALHRILEAIDAILSTAVSHQRSFVVEVMGRNCGWLALMAGIATGADFVLIPEDPPEDGWENKMCEALERGRESGRRCSMVIVAEGALDRQGKAISAGSVKKILEEHGHDTRITILGHVQRGGTPSALDRIASTLMGVAAAEWVLDAGAHDEPLMIGMEGNKIVRKPLMQCVELTRQVGKYIESKDFAQAMHARGPSFISACKIYNVLSKPSKAAADVPKKNIRIALMHSGAPSPGMNPAARALVRLGIDAGYTVLAVQNGFAGLAKGEVHEMAWMDVNGWALLGGAELGTNRSIPNPSNVADIAQTIEKHQIDVLIMFGGYTGYQGSLELSKYKDKYPRLGLPVLCVPGTIANNIPATESSIGADTALNNILDAVDKIKQSAVASRRVFVVEVMGADCGYLAVISALASGAERAYINEEGVTLKDLQQDLRMLIRRFEMGNKLGLVITSEKASETYSTHFVASLFKEEGKKIFDVRESILGHLQQGGEPSAWDRTSAAVLMGYCIELIKQGEGQINTLRSGAVGFIGGQVAFTPNEEWKEMMHPNYRRPKSQWWMSLIPTLKILATSPSPDLMTKSPSQLSISKQLSRSVLI